MSTKKSKLEILALHGYRQSDEIFKAKSGSLRKGFKNDINFTFIRAPHKIPLKEDSEENADKNGYGWWFNTPDYVFNATIPSELCVGFDDSVALIKRTFLEHGPFDGLLGFSQGAAFVTILCSMMKKQLLQIDFKFAIIISGFKSLCVPHAVYYCDEIEIPSLHIYGKSDQVIPNVMTEQISRLFPTRTEITHEGGHYIPSKKDIYRDFITKMVGEKRLKT